MLYEPRGGWAGKTPKTGAAAVVGGDEEVIDATPPLRAATFRLRVLAPMMALASCPFLRLLLPP